MQVRVVLYKSNFTDGDVFVGQSKADRQTQLSALPHLEVSGAFNPTDPFRIVGNFLQYDRKYDYCQYFYTVDGSEISRSYFIRGFEYVNDNLTRMIVTLDVIADNFHDLSFTNAFPDAYTYKAAVIESVLRSYETVAPEVYKITRSENFLLQVPVASGKLYYVGALIATAKVKNIIGFLQYGEAYPYAPFFFMFLIDESGNVYNGSTTIPDEPEFNNWSGFLASSQYPIIEGDIMPTIENYGSFLNLSVGSDFSFYSSTVNFSLGIDFATEFFTYNNKKYLAIYPIGSETGTGGGAWKRTELLGGNYYEYLSYIDVNIDLINIINVENIYDKIPYKKICIEFGENSIEIDPRIFNIGPAECRYVNSYVPPYGFSIAFTTARISDPNFYIEVLNEYASWRDSYADFLQNNYNSTITGLKVRQETASNNFGIKTITGSLSDALGNIGKIATGNVLGGVIGQFQSFTNTMGDTAIFNNNQALERTLQDLKLADLQNAPDTASFASSIRQNWLGKKYIRFVWYENVFYSDALQKHKMYGFSNGVPITQFKSHTVFDYIRVRDIEFKNADLFLSSQEMALLLGQFANGIRIWYNLSDYKNFSVDNAEVT